MTFKTLDQSMPQLQSSTTLPTVGLQTPLITPLGTQRARLLIGSSRKGEAEDPEIYVATIAAILSAYPEDVAIAVTHPVTGLATRTKFGGLALPIEVKEACEAAMAPRREAERKAAAAKHRADVLAERAELAERQQATDVERINRIAAEFRVDAAALHARQTAEEQVRRERMRARLDEMNRSICTVETPGGIMISPWLRRYLDEKVADRLSPTGPDHEGRRG